MRWVWIAIVIAAPCVLAGQGDGAKDERLRRPIALALVDEGKMLLVAERDSGSIARIDPSELRVLAETKVGRRLSDMAVMLKVILATDEEAGELLILSRAPIEVVGKVRVPPMPVSVCVDERRGLASVACLWARRLVVVDVGARKDVGVIDLPFAPDRQLLVPGSSRVIVADAFGGKLAVVDLESRKVESVRNLAIHNVGGLAIDAKAKYLLLTHQTINAQGRTTRGDILTSNVITNNVRKFALADVIDPLADLSRDDRLYQLGGVERGAGDPTSVAQGSDGQVVVTLGGVNEIAVGRPEQATWTHFPMPRRPTALVVDAASHRAFVANTFADSVSVVDLKTPRVVREVSLGVMPKLTQEQRGEMLFHDARLSFDAWYSCHSCHPRGHTNGRSNDNFSDGSFGTPKRILSLRGVKDTGPWAWSGQMGELDKQVHTSVTSTMQGPKPIEGDVNDVVAFVRSLPPAMSLHEARGTVDAEALKRGRKVFAREKCASCHAPPTYTTPKTYDVGLRDETGGKLFNPPSLRGVSQGGPFFHDGRAATLDDVFGRFRHQLLDPLSDSDRRDLIHFLENL